MDGIIIGSPKLRGMAARWRGKARGLPDRSFERAANNSLRSGLISWWPLDKASGTRFDLVGTNHLTAVNNPTGADGVNGPATQFVAASAQCLYVLDNPSLQVNRYDWEIAAWIKPTTIGYTIAKYSGSLREFALLNSSTTTYRIIIGDGTAVATVQAQSQTINLGEWVFITFGRSGTVVFITSNLNRVQTSLGSVVPAASTNEFCIGQLNHGNAGGATDATICSVGLWNRSLSNTERQKLFNGGLGFYPL